jgi:glycerol-3-phosphate dehydrogenase
MAEDAVDYAATLAELEPRACVTRDLNIHGYLPNAARHRERAHYGSDAGDVEALLASSPAMAERLHPHLRVYGGEVVWAAREEMARTVDDVLARRTRGLLFDARAAIDVAPRVACLLAEELGRDADWQRAQVEEFTKIAKNYLPQ